MILAPIALAMVSNLSTNTIRISAWWWPWAVWSASCLLVAITVLVEMRHKRSHGQESPAGDPAELDKAADQLAQSVGAQWRSEQERQRLHDPGPIPVHWRPADELMDHRDNICRASPEADSGPLALDGSLERIVGFYQRIPSGRLVVLGKAGAGKTILALQFVVGLLDIRTSTHPVPVLFRLGSWNPYTSSLRDWLAGELTREHPALAAPGPGGPSLADALIAADRILPVLDGFDEIADELRCAALGKINATAMPFLLTSRHDDYATTVRDSRVLRAAAVIRIDDLTPSDLDGYLPLTTIRTAIVGQNPGGSPGTVWGPVIARLREQRADPEARLLQVLSTPLMVTLARAIYSDTPDRNPAELLDPGQFRTTEELEGHLLHAFIPAAYQKSPRDQRPGGRQPWNAVRDQRWLGYLAAHLDRLGTRDLTLWQLGDGTSRLPCALLAGSAVFLVFWLTGLLNATPFYAAVFALALGLAGGLSFGLGSRLRPSRAEMRFRGTAIPYLRRFAAGSALGLMYGLTCGLGLDFALIFALVSGLAFGSYVWLHIPAIITAVPAPLTVLRQDRVATLTFGLGAGLACGTGLALIAWHSGPPATVEPATIVASTLMGVAAGIAIGGLSYGRVGGIVFGATMGTLTLAAHWTPGGVSGLVTSHPGTVAYGALYGLGIALVVVLPRAWGTYTLSRLWLALRGHLPWRLMAFLEHARDCGVLRQSGGVYQFRHARLQEHLARTYQAQLSRTDTQPSLNLNHPERRRRTASPLGTSRAGRSGYGSRHGRHRHRPPVVTRR